jgi:superfamily II DNA/RNA helicase
MHPFAKLGLDAWIQRLCDKMGYREPTNIQRLAFPPILAKKHVIGEWPLIYFLLSISGIY